MKKLLLIRHAKAVHDNSYTDFERPLKPKGMQDAMMMAGRLKDMLIIPQLLITSPSLRTQATAEIFSEHLPAPKPRQNKGIYEAGQQTLCNIINDFEDAYDFIGLVGHNPGISQMLYYFADETRDVPPGAVALMEFDVDEWKMLGRNTGTLTWYSSPKDN